MIFLEIKKKYFENASKLCGQAKRSPFGKYFILQHAYAEPKKLILE